MIPISDAIFKIQKSVAFLQFQQEQLPECSEYMTPFSNKIISMLSKISAQCITITKSEEVVNTYEAKLVPNQDIDEFIDKSIFMNIPKVENHPQDLL